MLDVTRDRYDRELGHEIMYSLNDRTHLRDTLATNVDKAYRWEVKFALYHLRGTVAKEDLAEIRNTLLSRKPYTERAENVARSIVENTRRMEEDRAYNINRIETIARTENTVGITLAQTKLLELLRKKGYAFTQVWITARDEIVCPLCNPLHLTDRSVWKRKAKDGPPLHPRCRCILQLRAFGKQYRSLPK